MTSSLARLDRRLLYPPLWDVLERRVLPACDAAGQSYVATEGFRDAARQDQLYAQGRTADGPIVTHAQGWQSPHDFGLGTDWAPLNPDGTVKDPLKWTPEDFAVLVRAAAAEGLDCGAHWQHPDCPHVGWNGFRTATELRPLRALAQGTPAEWLPRVWSYVDGCSPTMPIFIGTPETP